MIPNNFGKERTLFGAKFGYGRWANTSSLGNGFTRVARIKQGEDGVLLSKRERLDHDAHMTVVLSFALVYISMNLISC